MDRYAILVDGEVQLVSSVLEWAEWFEAAERIIARLETGNGTISTVFLGSNHQFSFDKDAPPLWFETLVFGGTCDQHMDRYTTLEEAMAGHERIVQMVLAHECDTDEN